MRKEDRHFSLKLKDGSSFDSVALAAIWLELRRLEETDAGVFAELTKAVDSDAVIGDATARARLADMFFVDAAGIPTSITAAVLKNSRRPTPEGETLLPPFAFQSPGERERFTALMEWIEKREQSLAPDDLLAELEIHVVRDRQRRQD